jgi:hypothetical protein
MMGRPARPTKGNKKDRQIRDFCRRLIGDPLYQRNLLSRLRFGELSPAVEAMIWYYAIGKPPDKLVLEGEDRPPLLFVLQRELGYDPLSEASPIPENTSLTMPTKPKPGTAQIDVEDLEAFEPVDGL